VEEEEQEAHRQFVAPRTMPSNSAKTAKKKSAEETVSLSKEKQSPKNKPSKANGAPTAATKAKAKKRSAREPPLPFTDEGEEDDEEDDESDKNSSGDDGSSDKGDGEYVPKKKNKHVPSKKVSVVKKKESEDGFGSLSSSSSSSPSPSSSSHLPPGKKAKADDPHVKKPNAPESPENSTATALTTENGVSDIVGTCASDMSKLILSHKHIDPIEELGFFVYVIRALEVADPNIDTNSVIGNCARTELERVLDVKLQLVHTHDYIKKSLVAHLTELEQLLKTPDSEPQDYIQLLKRLSKIARIIDILLPHLAE